MYKRFHILGRMHNASLYDDAGYILPVCDCRFVSFNVFTA